MLEATRTAVQTDDARLSDARKCDNTFNDAATARSNLGLDALATLALTADRLLYVGHDGAPAQLAHGSSGQVLTSQGVATAPAWTSPSGLPVGAVVAVASETIPTGYLECNGAAVSRTTYASLYAAIGVFHGSGDGSTTFNLPDYRGRFLRGWDHAAGRDPDKSSRTAMATGGQTGDHVGSVQTDQLRSHTHTVDTGSGGSGSYPSASCSSASSFSSGSSGGNETRPVNAGVMYCIKY
jgi:microcystin-dependent protein